MSERAYADSEVGRLRTVLLHRPGPELKRLTPRNNDALLFDDIPWVGRLAGSGRGGPRCMSCPILREATS